MRKLLFFFCGAFALFFIGCNKEVENHQTQLMRPLSGTSVMAYADQEWDSISIMSTESYSLASSVPWCVIPEAYRTLRNPYANTLVLSTVPVQLDANTSGAGRMALIQVQAGEYSVTASIYQYPYLDISSPMRDRLSGSLYELQVSRDALSSAVTFTAFANWTLRAKDGTWLHVADVASAGGEGTHTVSFTLDANSSGADRRDTLLLTSRGVTDKIPVAQLQ